MASGRAGGRERGREEGREGSLLDGMPLRPRASAGRGEDVPASQPRTRGETSIFL